LNKDLVSSFYVKLLTHKQTNKHLRGIASFKGTSWRS